MKRAYQNIEVGGKDMGYTAEKKGSKFCNEGKWENFIKPLLPKDCSDMTFVELGCNAGMFCKLAKQHGFRNVIGVDKSRYSIKHAINYRRESGFDYTLINEKIGEYFDYDKIPVADVTVMSNFHYYLTINELMLLLDKMKFKTRYCIIVTDVDVEKDFWRARASMNSVRHYFKDWREVNCICPIPVGEDTYPRKLASLMFESDLERRPIKDLYRTSLRNRSVGNVEDLVKRVATSDTIENVEQTPYYKTTQSLHTQWKKKDVDNWVGKQIKNLYNVKKNGVKYPIWIQSNGHIIDGKHRMLYLKEIGYKSIIVRKI